MNRNELRKMKRVIELIGSGKEDTETQLVYGDTRGT